MFAIIFKNGKETTPLYEIADKLDVEHLELARAFKYWGENDYPQEFFYPIEEGELSRGGTYDIGIKIWNYQGGYPYSKGEPYHMGIVSKARSWGITPAQGKVSYRELPEYTRFYFNLEAIA